MNARIGFQYWILSRSVFDPGPRLAPCPNLQKAIQPQSTHYYPPYSLHAAASLSAPVDDIGSSDDAWNIRYGEILQYQREHDNTLVPRKYNENIPLGEWVQTQRKNYKANNLSPERMNKLNKIGFVWDVLETQWLERFEDLLQYKEEHNNTLVPYHYPRNPSLGSWVNKQRIDYKANNLSPERMDKLDGVGFVWDVLEAQWLERFQELVHYIKENGDALVPVMCKEDTRYVSRDLGCWVNSQRQSYKMGDLSSERIQMLNDVGFVWDPHEFVWSKNFEELIEYKKKHGNTRVPHLYAPNRPLGTWVMTQRSNYKAGFLSSQQIQKLNQIGFSWDANQDKWLERYDELIQYKEEHGDTIVPAKYVGNPTLGNWVARQRVNYKADKLSPEKIQRLDDIGFVWVLSQRRKLDKDDSALDPDEAQWMKRFEELLEYVQEHGNPNLPKEYKENPSLEAWVHHQRQLRKARKQTSKHVKLLNGIGFVWETDDDEPVDDTWLQQFGQLLKYVKQHGNAQVPLYCKDNILLGVWVGKQRQEYKANTLGSERIEKLNEIGFVWEPVEG